MTTTPNAIILKSEDLKLRSTTQGSNAENLYEEL
jgi:hypothetical protein